MPGGKRYKWEKESGERKEKEYLREGLLEGNDKEMLGQQEISLLFPDYTLTISLLDLGFSGTPKTWDSQPLFQI